jgi:hypothetical protein
MPFPARTGGKTNAVYNVAPPDTTLAEWNRAWDKASAANAAAHARTAARAEAKAKNEKQNVATYPAAFEKAFVTSGLGTGSSYKQMTCALRYIEHRVPYSTVQAAEYRILTGDSPQWYLDAARSCR